MRTDALLTRPNDPGMINPESEFPRACLLIDGIIHGGNTETFLRGPRSDISRVQWEINLEWRKELCCTGNWFDYMTKFEVSNQDEKHRHEVRTAENG